MYKALVTITALVIQQLTGVSGVSSNNDFGLCCLCGDCKPPLPSRGNFIVNAYGKTCNDLALEMADPSNSSTKGSSDCKRKQNLFSNACCNADFKPIPHVQAPTVSPAAKYPKGDNPECHICHDRSFPQAIGTVVAILQMPGTYSCKDLYYLGLNGMITDQLCNPLVDYVDVPCGCGHKLAQQKENENETKLRKTEPPTTLPSMWETVAVEKLITSQEPLSTVDIFVTMTGSFDDTDIPSQIPIFEATNKTTIVDMATNFSALVGATTEPTLIPTIVSSAELTGKHTTRPTIDSTEMPTSEFTITLNAEQTVEPTKVPTTMPTRVPTYSPTETPTVHRTEKPTMVPTDGVTDNSTAKPNTEANVSTTKEAKTKKGKQKDVGKRNRSHLRGRL